MLKSLSLLLCIGLIAPISHAGWFGSSKSEPPITANNVPDAKCIYRSKSIEVPGSEMRISQFEVWTSRRGNEDREPVITSLLKFRNSSFKDVGTVTIPMSDPDVSWTAFDRHMRPKTINESTFRKDVEIGKQKYNLVMKRMVPDVWSLSPVVHSEMQIFTQDEKPKLVARARCVTELSQKK